MQSARLEAVERLYIRELEAPEPGPDDVVLRVEACGICGTDRHIFHGDYSSALPVTPGHEFAGTIVAHGDRSPWPDGTRATVDPNISCGRCAECRRGEVCLCPGRVALGVDLDGGFAEYVAAPSTQIYPLPSGVPIEWGALCEPLACCLHGLDLVPIRPGMTVAVIGGGIIGQLMVQLCHLAGARVITLITRQADRRLLAEQLGATDTCDPRASDPVDAVRARTGFSPGGADVVLECVGSTETFEQATAMARRGGSVLIFGVAPQHALARVSPFAIFERELRIVGSYLNPLTHGRAVEMVASRRLELDRLITERLSLEELPAVLAGSPRPGDVKSMVIMPCS